MEKPMTTAERFRSMRGQMLDRFEFAELSEKSTAYAQAACLAQLALASAHSRCDCGRSLPNEDSCGNRCGLCDEAADPSPLVVSDPELPLSDALADGTTA